MTDVYFWSDIEERVTLHYADGTVFIYEDGTYRVLNEDNECILEGGFFRD